MEKENKNIFRRKEIKGLEKYSSVGDFFLNAPREKQIEVFTEAAHRANEDQLKVFNEAQKKLGIIK